MIIRLLNKQFCAWTSLSKRFFKVLGIETSFDDTSVAIVEDNGKVHYCETISQERIHRPFGGTFPYFTRSIHEHALYNIFKHKISDNGISAVAVTRGPGMNPALSTGLFFARTISNLLKIPLYMINHMVKCQMI